MGTPGASARRARDWASDVLVDPQWLEEHLDDPALGVVEVDVSRGRFDEGHIPGATLWDVSTDLKDAEYRLVDRERIRAVLERSGITPESTVVFYGYAPALGFWLTKLLGHTEARVLDASRETWQEAERSWSAETASATRTVHPLPDADERIRARLPAVRDAIGDPRRVVVDARTEPEYRGEWFWPSGAFEDGGRAGHIPSAVLVPAAGLYAEDGTFQSAAELRRVYAPIDLDSGDEVITCCTIGGRAATTWFVLTSALGHERTRLYDGSWAEWGRTPGTPVERG